MPLTTHDRIVESMFLSPRVVDSATFEELTGMLRTIVQHAVEHQAELERAIAHAEGACDQISQTSERLKAAMAPAARLLQTLDDRVAKAQQSLQDLADPQELIETRLVAMREQIEQSLGQRGQDVVDAALMTLSERAEQQKHQSKELLDSQLAHITEATRASEDRIAQANAALASGVKAAEASIIALTRRAVEKQVSEVIQARLAAAEQDTLSRITAVAAEAERALNERIRDAGDTLLRCERVAQELECRLGEVSDRLHSQAQQADSQARDALDQTEQALKQIRETVGHAREQVLNDVNQQAAQIHRDLLDRLNATGSQATRYAERTEDTLAGLEARAAAIGERLARRIDDLAADAEMVSQDAERRAGRVSAVIHQSEAATDAASGENTGDPAVVPAVKAPARRRTKSA